MFSITKSSNSYPVKIPETKTLEQSLLGVHFEYERQKKRRSPKKLEKLAVLDMVIHDLNKLIKAV